jgi:hypothetical protein
MAERMRKPNLKQSPCTGCLNLDSDENIHYCSIVTNPDLFMRSFFGNEIFEDEIVPKKERTYKNCPHKEYLG